MDSDVYADGAGWCECCGSWAFLYDLPDGQRVCSGCLFDYEESVAEHGKAKITPVPPEPYSEGSERI